MFHQQWHTFLSLVFGLANSCSGKADYKSKATATKAKKAMEVKRAPKLFDAYKCFWCNGWHIGGSIQGRFWSSLWHRLLIAVRIREPYNKNNRT
jgi:hypothetical protein